MLAIFISWTSLTTILRTIEMVLKGAPELFSFLNSPKHLILCSTKQKTIFLIAMVTEQRHLYRFGKIFIFGRILG